MLYVDLPTSQHWHRPRGGADGGSQNVVSSRSPALVPTGGGLSPFWRGLSLFRTGPAGGVLADKGYWNLEGKSTNPKESQLRRLEILRHRPRAAERSF